MAVIALIAPDPKASSLLESLGEQGHMVIPIAPAPDVEGQLGPGVAALACDFVLVEISARIGIDQAVVEVWQWVEQAQMPRAVVVSGLAEGFADFDDLVALAQRLFNSEAVAVRLPVYDDDHHAVASLDVSTLLIHDESGTRPSEEGHRSVSAGSRSELCAALAAVVPDDDLASELLAATIETEGDSAGGVVLLPTPMVGPPDGAVKDVSTAVTEAIGEGSLVPVVAATTENAWTADVSRWVRSETQGPTQRLLYRDCDDNPTVSGVAVVLASQGRGALVRCLSGSVQQGEALLTAPGMGRNHTPTPFRAWPTYVTNARELGDNCWDVRSEIQAEAGDALVDSPTWVVPLPVD